VFGKERFEVIGSSCLYVVGGARFTHSNIAEAEPDWLLSMYDVRLHVLSASDAFDVARRRPAEAPDFR